MSGVRCHFFFLLLLFGQSGHVVKLVGEGSVINGAYQSSFDDIKGEQGSKSILDPCLYWENTSLF